MINQPTIDNLTTPPMTNRNFVRHLKRIGVSLNYGVSNYPVSFSYSGEKPKINIDQLRGITINEWEKY